MNIIAIKGRLVLDPECKKTQNGVTVCNITVAVDRAYSNGGEKQTDFLTVVAWRQAADFVCKYFGKGDMIAVQGELQTRRYEDKDGNKRTATEIVADNVSFCGGKKDSTQAAAQTGKSYDDYAGNDDDLPF